MQNIDELLEQFANVSNDPGAALQKQVDAGKQVIGIGPYYAPEELVYAAGAIPFGIWGIQGSSAKAKEYFPPFYCSICQMTLEMGLNHQLDKLAGFMVTGLCDTLKAFSQNWKAGVQRVPLIYVSQPQNRKIEAGRKYAVASYAEVKQHVEECCGVIIHQQALYDAICLYNKWRLAMKMFVNIAGTHPRQVSVAARTSVINAGYYLDKAEHLTMVKKLNAALSKLPTSHDEFHRVVISGIYEDIPALTEILHNNKYAIVADDLAKESRSFELVVPESGDPVEALAEGWCALDSDSILFNPDKPHVNKVLDLVQQTDAQGVIILLAKFCDPEEFDAPLITKACCAADIPCVTIEIDQSTDSYEQARTQLETFKDLL